MFCKSGCTHELNEILFKNWGLKMYMRHPIMVAHIIVVQCISTPNSQGCSVFAAKFPDVSMLKNSKIQILLTFYCICKILSCTIAVCTAVKIVIQLIGIGSTLISIIIYAWGPIFTSKIVISCRRKVAFSGHSITMWTR